ncbi:hypothetical protein HEP87_56920 [Streptomyces sp. S1D4-11]
MATRSATAAGAAGFWDVAAGVLLVPADEQPTSTEPSAAAAMARRTAEREVRARMTTSFGAFYLL